MNMTSLTSNNMSQMTGHKRQEALKALQNEVSMYQSLAFLDQSPNVSILQASISSCIIVKTNNTAASGDARRQSINTHN